MNRDVYYAYIGTNSVRGSQGIYTLRIDGETGQGEAISSVPAYNAGGISLSLDERTLYAASEGMTFQGHASGGVTAFHADGAGTLTEINGRPTTGQRTCCVAVDGRGENVYACDFYKGTWNAFPLDGEGRIGPARLTVFPPESDGWQAAHCVDVIQGKYVGLISLLEGALVIYRASDGERITSYAFPGPDHPPFTPFPRYFTSVGDHIYVMMQMPDDIYVFESSLDRDGSIRLLQKISVMDDAHRTMPATSTIRITPDGKLVLAANRPSNSITIFSRQADGTLRFERFCELPGNGPRDFHISRDGRFVVAAMQHSDEVAILALDSENCDLKPVGDTVKVPSPAAVAVTGRRITV